MTGSTVFDFEGDGRVEIVYRDEEYLYVFRVPEDELATTLETPLLLDGFDSFTAAEMPIVVDVDGDGNAEIVVPQDEGNMGVYVIEDLNDSWVSTRGIWNQHSYHITNINDDGTIPQFEEPSWLSHNTYRLNTIADPDFDPFDAPDLIPSYVRVNESGGETTYMVRIGNAGSALVGQGVKVALFNGDPANGGVQIEVGETIGRIDPGQYEDVSIKVSGAALPDGDLWIIADWDGNDVDIPSHGYVRECHDTGQANNNNVYNPVLGYAPPPANADPTIDSAAELTAVEGQTYTYDVNASDTDGHTLAYDLRQAPDSMSIDSVTGQITWTPTSEQLGLHQVAVRVRDGFGGIDLQPYLIRVVSANSAPTLVIPDYGFATPNEIWRLQLEADDPNGDALTYRVVEGPSGSSVSATGEVTWTPAPADQGGASLFIIEASDGRGGVTQRGFWVVVDVNASPRITSKPDDPVYLLEPWTYTATAQDSEDGTSPAAGLLKFSLDDASQALGASINEDTGVLTWTPTAEGTFAITVIVTDSGGAAARQRLTLPVNVRPASGVNEPPWILSQPTGPAVAGRSWRYQVVARDDNGDELRYALEPAESGGVLPTGLQINDTTGLVTWATTAAGSHTFIVKAYELNTPGSYTTQTVTLPVLSKNAPVIVEAVASTSAKVDQPIGLTFKVMDWDGGVLDFEVLPGGAAAAAGTSPVFNPTSLASASTDPNTPDQVTLTFTPADIGSQSLTIRVTDADGLSTTHTVYLEVFADTATNQPPTLSVAARQSIALGETFIAQVDGIDPENDGLTYALIRDGSNPVPAGMVIDAQTGLIRWTPTEADLTPATGSPYTYRVSVDDSVNPIVEMIGHLELTVTAASTPNQAPVITSRPDGLSGAWDQPLVYDATAEDADGDPLTWALVSGPSTASISAKTGRFVWHPSDTELGLVQEAVIAVSDPYGGYAEQTITLGTTPGSVSNQPPLISSAPGLKAADGKLFTFDVPATDPDGGLLTYALVDGVGGIGSAVDGVSIDADGQVSWTATGTSKAFTVQVTDDTGLTARRTFNIEVVTGSVPTVELRVSDDRPAAGGRVDIAVVADDEVGIKDVRLQLVENWAGGRTLILPLDARGVASYVPPFGQTGQTVTITATVTNTGDVSASAVTALTIAAADTLAPRVSIATPYPGQRVDQNLTITGSAYDQDNTDLRSVRLTLESFDGSSTQIIYDSTEFGSTIANFGSAGVAVDLATLTTSALANGAYRLVLEAVDLSGKSARTSFDLTIDSDVKLGNFALSFTDLSIPLGGFPITIQRSYDTLDADRIGDFGYGWSMEMLTGQATVSNLAGDDLISGDPFLGSVFETGYRAGTRVEFELPGGQTVGFTAYPVPINTGGAAARFASVLLGQGASLFAVAFLPDADTDAKLEFTGGSEFRFPDEFADRMSYGLFNSGFQSAQVQYDENTGAFLTSGTPFNPASFDYDFRLSTADGTSYTFDSQSGALISVTDSLGNTITPDYDGVESRPVGSSESTKVQIIRDSQGRITEIRDPGGNAIEYGYDVDGNLEWVKDRTGRVTSMDYGQTEFSDGVDVPIHILTSITQYPNSIPPVVDPEALILAGGGVDAMQIGFNADGTVKQIGSEGGSTTGLGYNLDGPSIGLPAGYTLEAVTDENGVPTEYIRDAKGLIMRQMTRMDAATDTWLVSVFGYDSNGFASVTWQPFEAVGTARYTQSPTIKLSETEFDERGNAFRSTTYVDGQAYTTEYSYDDHDRPSGIKDALGNKTVYTYDNNGNRDSVTDALGNTTLYDYDPAGNLRQVTDALGNIVSKMTYDDRGRVLTSTDANDLTQNYVYDGSGNRTSETYTWVNPDTPNDQQQVTYNLGYDDEGRMTLTFDEHGNQSEVTYDALGRESGFVNQWNRSEHIVFDVEGNPIQRISADGSTSEAIFDLTDPDGRANISAFEHMPGELTAGLRIVYDDLGRIVRKDKLENLRIDLVPDPNHPGFSKAVLVGTPTVVGVGQRIYDSVGRLYRSIEPDGQVTEYEYDELGRTKAIIEDATGFAYRTSYTFDALGRTKTVTGPDNRTTTYEYDALGRTTRTIFDDGTFIRNQYDALGRITDTIDQLGRVTSYRYDAAGNQTDVLMPAITDPDDPTQTVRPTIHYDYDKYGNLAAVTDANGHTTTFKYDAFGRQIERTTHLGQTETSTFGTDPDSGVEGVLLSRTDAAGRRVDYDYDAAGRTESESWFMPGQGTADLVIDYTYDSFGQVDTVTETGGRVTDYDFDEKGRLVKVVSPEGTIRYEWSEDLDLLERVYTGSDPLNPVTDITYTYDALRRLKTVTAVKQDGQAVNQTATYHYGPRGEVTQVDLPNGVVATYGYTDALGRLTDISFDRSGQNLATYQYVHDDTGRRTRATGTINGVTRVVDYTFDELGRLIEEDVDSGVRVVSYGYDLMGNRLSSEDSQGGLTTYTYDADGRLDYQTLGNVVTDFVYDAAGATTAKVVLTDGVETSRTDYVYDVRGLLSQADVGGDGVFELSYDYDANGTLVGRTDGGVATDYLVDALNPTGYSQVIEETTGGNLDVSYVYGLLGAISQNQGGTQSTYLTDGLGSVTALTDASGVITDTYTYNAFGEVVASTGTTDNVVRFTGERYDLSLGQYELRARRYDPSIGRFTTSDPLQGTGPAVLNQYAYANADPANLIDPTGQFSIVGLLKAAGITSTIVSIAFPAYQTGAAVKKLLDLNDFTIAMRKGLDAGWLDFGDFLPMHQFARHMGVQLAARVAAGTLEIAQAVLEMTSWGSIFSWAQVGGAATSVSDWWTEAEPETGNVSGNTSIGDASFVEKAWYVINASAKGSRAGHHLIPNRALQQNIWDTWGLLRKRKLKNAGVNIVDIDVDAHKLLHAELREAGLQPGPGRKLTSIYSDYGTPEGYLDALGTFYKRLEGKYPGKFDGIGKFYENARGFIGPEHLAAK